MAAGLRFEEQLDGFFGPNIRNFKDGEDYGIRHENTVLFDVKVEIDSIDRFVGLSKHEAPFVGTFLLESLAGKEKMEIKNGRYNLMNIDPNTGHRTISYRFNFKDPDGKVYYFFGYKDIYNDTGKLDMTDDLTTLFVRVYEGQDDTGEIYGSGIMYFRMKELTPLIFSMKAFNGTLLERFLAPKKYLALFIGEAMKTYMQGARFTYHTRYENLVLSGKLTDNADGNNGTKDFFFFSGEHDKGFPWGDGETMSDVALLIIDSNGNSEKYGMTKRALEGLRVDIERNVYSYKGELYKIENGNTVSFSGIHNTNSQQNIRKVFAEFEISLDADKYNSKIDLTFQVIEELEKHVPDKYEDEIKKLIPFIGPMGVFITPYRIKVNEGTLKLIDNGNEEVYDIDTDNTLGEGEISDINNLKEPTLYYNYICGINPLTDKIFLKIDSGTLRDERDLYFKDMFDKALGKVVERKIKKNVILGDGIECNDSQPQVIDNNIFSILNDHYPTATFERRIVKMENGDETFYALEEYINQINLAPINSDKSTTVAVGTYKDVDDDDGSAPSEEKVKEVYGRKEKFDVLDDVIKESGFFDVLEKQFNGSGKTKEKFSIIIKPNFMFTYNKDDRTTFTDPTLVEHLIKRLEEKQFKNIKIAEAECTLSVFFQNRDVKAVAEYIGYEGSSLDRMIDMTEGNNTEEVDFGGRLGRHPVDKDWANADFRISFAKNKTHSYAFYTLTLKNIYGALSRKYKYKVYHHEFDDIYGTTIDFIKKYKVHFGFIDAIIGADGPFGIFADPCPQLTKTIIGGEDIVAVDWVGSGKMSLDPMISKYMQEAVKAFGKPRIKIVGDGRTYKYWANIPRISSIFSHEMLDKHYSFGFVIYYTLSEMDTNAFPSQPSQSEFINSLRDMAAPIRELIFKEPDQQPSGLHNFINQIAIRMMQ